MTEAVSRPSPAWPTDQAPRRGLSYIPAASEGMSPLQMEQLLAELYNEHIRAEIARRNLNDHLLDCTLEYEKALLCATTDPECPKPNRSDVTVAQRDAWIRGMIFDEYSALEMAKTNLENQDRYLKTLSDNTSKMQTVSGFIRQANSVPNSGHVGR